MSGFRIPADLQNEHIGMTGSDLARSSRRVNPESCLARLSRRPNSPISLVILLAGVYLSSQPNLMPSQTKATILTSPVFAALFSTLATHGECLPVCIDRYQSSVKARTQLQRCGHVGTDPRPLAHTAMSLATISKGRFILMRTCRTCGLPIGQNTGHQLETP